MFSKIFIQSALFLALAVNAFAAPIYTYKVIAKYPHSTDSYTEGFFYLNGLKSQFAAIVTDGQGERKGQLFRIAHIGFFDYMDTIAIIGALEQVIYKTKFPAPNFTFGKGLIAAHTFFAEHAK